MNGKKTGHAVSDDGAGSFDVYQEYNRVLRTWFVAFGIGGPALFLTNNAIALRLKEAGELKLVSVLFLVGVGCQIAGALINKIANWYSYKMALDGVTQPAGWPGCMTWLAGQFWIDVLLDAVTTVAFVCASWKVFTIFA